jgi:hypothetical protein
MENVTIDQQKLYDGIGMLLEEDGDKGLNILIELYNETKDYEVKSNTSTMLFYHYFWTDKYEVIENLNILEFFKLNPTFIDLVNLGLKYKKAISYSKDALVLPMTYNEISTPLIKVMLNNVSHTFWVDPSVSLSSISEDFIEVNDLKDSVEIVSHEENYDPEYLILNQFEVGNLKIENQCFLVLPSEYSVVDFSDEKENIKIDGVIGMDIIKYLDFTMDFNSNTYIIKTPTIDKKKHRNIIFDNFLLGKVDYKEMEVIVGIDPLQDQTFMNETFYDENDIPYKTSNIQSEGPEGYEVIQADYVDALTIGINGLAFELENVWNVGQMMTDIYQVDGVLGGDILRKSILHFDISNRYFSVE